MYTNVNNSFFNRKRTNILLATALIFVLSIFAVGCDSPAEATTVAEEAAVQETAVDTTVIEPVSVEAVEMTAIELTDAAVIETTTTVNNQNGNGNNNGANADPEHIIATDLAALNGDITEAEADGLIFMREEEKLARDVYLTLYDIWGTAVFNNIASSEQIHMDAVLMLMDQYELADPAAGNAVGVFVNSDLQVLYDQLVATGSQSLADALAAGVAIEEIDIVDLDKFIAETTNPAILQVYGSLLTGSESHLRAFVPQLERQTGETYIPQYMSQEQYDAIMSAAGNGQQGGGNGQGGNGQGGNGKGGNGQGSNETGGNSRGSNG